MGGTVVEEQRGYLDPLFIVQKNLYEIAKILSCPTQHYIYRSVYVMAVDLNSIERGRYTMRQVSFNKSLISYVQLYIVGMKIQRSLQNKWQSDRRSVKLFIATLRRGHWIGSLTGPDRSDTIVICSLDLRLS